MGPPLLCLLVLQMSALEVIVGSVWLVSVIVVVSYRLIVRSGCGCLLLRLGRMYFLRSNIGQSPDALVSG